MRYKITLEKILCSGGHMLIAREKEKEALLKLVDSDESQFAAIYGRRRVGKTYLIRQTFNNKFTFQHAGYANGNKEEELFGFCASLREYGFADFEKPTNWLEAFEILKDLIRRSSDEKKLIFIDELSWLDTPKSDFLIALEAFWNSWASARNDIVLIVCGSATTWITNNIIHNKGGLYNRLSLQIHLEPFTLGECEKYTKAMKIVMNRHQMLECYMIMGGVPYYWSLLQKGKSLPQNIDAIFFDKDAPLKNEFKYLYSSLYKNPEKYIKVISALGKKKAGMTRMELLDSTGLSNSGAFSTILEDLEECGFIRKYYEYGKKERGSIYQLIDNFTLFYFKFIEKRPSDSHFWENQINTSAVNSWCGLAFERVCLEHVAQIKKALGISGVLTDVNAWSCTSNPDSGVHGSQIDLLIVRKDQIINVCEMKYSSSKFSVTAKVDEEIRNKISDFITLTKTNHAIHPTIVTPYGLANTSYAFNIQATITADDLFA